jgi:predicted NUDIX family phosphoesterase
MKNDKDVNIPIPRNEEIAVPQDEIERVLVVPTELFHRLGHFQGFSGEASRYLDELLRPEHTSYRPRDQVEKDPGFKQLIPYMIFRHVDGAGTQRVFQYTRGTGQGEGRLHSKRSVGIGGHISAIDATTNGVGNPYEEGMRRELEEEVAVETPYRARCVGMINDDQTEVGRVHLGIVHLFDVERPAVRPRESEIIECGFRPVEAILADMTGFETWSQICMTALFGEKQE